MRARQARKPGRVKLAFDDGSVKYATMERADEPIVEGDPLNPFTLLKDETAASYGHGKEAVPDTIFRDILAMIQAIGRNQARVTTKFTTSGGVPIANTLVYGLLNEAGEANKVLTNDQGVAVGYVNAGSVTVGLKGFADIEDNVKTFTALAGQLYNFSVTNVVLRPFVRILQSGTYMFSGMVTRVDGTAVGGGGGGAGAQEDASGAGGGGGYCTVKENLQFTPNAAYSAVIGAGGKGSSGARYGNPGEDGSESYFGSREMLSANGGKGAPKQDNFTGGKFGAGNGNGGSSGSSGEPNGKDGTVLGYYDASRSVRYGGGGGAGKERDNVSSLGRGGADYGADGSGRWSERPAPAEDNSGGGGGGGALMGSSYGGGGNGGSGIIVLRMTHKGV